MTTDEYGRTVVTDPKLVARRLATNFDIGKLIRWNIRQAVQHPTQLAKRAAYVRQLIRVHRLARS